MRVIEEHKGAEKETNSSPLIPLNLEVEAKVFPPGRGGCDLILIAFDIRDIGYAVRDFLDQGKAHEAILLFLQTVKSLCRHFVADEHYDYFDDMYDPDFAAKDIADKLNKAYSKGKIPQTEVDFFHEAWIEIEKEEAYWNYGVANYKMRF